MSSRNPRGAAHGGGAGGGRRRAAASGVMQTPRHVRMIQEDLARARAASEAAAAAAAAEAQRQEEEKRAKEEEERRLREERRKRRQEEGRKRGEREEKRRMEAARRRLGVTVADAAGGGAQKRPVYEARKPKVQPKRHDNAQSEADGGETQGLKRQLEDEQSNALPEDINSAVCDVLKSGEEQSTGSSGEDRRIDDDDAWENKSFDDFDVLLRGESPCFREEEKSEEKHVTSAAPITNSISVPEEIEEDEVYVPLDEGSSNRVDRELRAPICCILGHVDAGKTKLLDCIRRTNVQRGEAGGITQQIGATYLPVENIRERTSLKVEATIKVPGLLVIDTPGHQSFSNMRSRGSSLCDVAVVVVDITRGLEKQTIESLDLLKRRNLRFVVALNKVDRLYGWKTCPNAPIVKALNNQSDDVQREFKWRATEVITQFKECGFNTALYYENKKIKEVVNIVPTSAVSGEGIPDLLLLLVRWVPEIMMERLNYVDSVECTVLEVNEDKDYGATIDVVLINGALRKGDQIVVCTKQGPLTTSIRYLLTPCPMKESGGKGSYKHHEELKGAQGVKIVARGGLQHAMAGTALIALKPVDGLEQAEAAVMQDVSKAISLINENDMGENEDGTAIQEISRIKTFREGVYVQASSLGTLEAITEHLKTLSLDVPVSGCNLGPVHKQDVIKATTMLKRKEEYAAILAFDVKVMPEAFDLAAESGVKIFTADTVYKLVDSFTDHIKKLKEERKKQCASDTVFPCTLKILPNRVYHSKDPIVCDVEVLEGVVKVGTPICVCVPSKDRGADVVHGLGRISSIKTSNGMQIHCAKKGVVSIKIMGENPQEKSRLYGRHFNANNDLLSQISRKSIDVLKEHYRDEMSDENWQLIRRLKKQFGIS
ncbi:eukaryotic translation initiation factor 5B-like [Phragmites australis]|uniref:eukaryotic translation initiation factor 5B-like n=1 Tax=Phragmites australis TaxID=29695 RepID=UPI002D7844BD|nr:eukaryotic translation initiation factor 5B-like [Phragmites australis]